MELIFEQKKFTRNAKNGRFLKGHEPFNKGKKMTEYLSEEKINKLKSNLKRTGRSNIGGGNKVKIIAIKNGEFSVFESSTKAANLLNLHASNIIKCCQKKRNSTGGIQFFYEKDNDWINFLNKETC